MTSISAPASAVAETSAAILSYLDALALAEPLLERLWQVSHLTLTQLAVMRQLRAGPHTAGKLAELAGLSAASTSRLVDRLERRGLVGRRREAEDRRLVEVHLTAEGERLLGEAKVFRGSDLHRAMERMSPEDRRRLTVDLTRLVELTRGIAAGREARS